MDDEALREKVRKLYKKYPVNPDRELLNWEKWITIRKDEISHISKALHEEPIDLTMNLHEKVRADKERKTVLEHAQLKRKVTIRGGPWELPIRLIQKRENEPIYEMRENKTDLGRPPIIEHIGVPQHLQFTEKGLTGVSQRNPCNKVDADYRRYRQKRETELQKRIKKINPYSPDIDKLIVIGERPKTPPPPPPLLPELVFKQSFEPHVVSLVEVYAIRINNSVFFKSIPYHSLSQFKKLQSEEWHENCNNWTYYFNVPTGNVGRSTMILQNLGTVTLRYCWKKIKRSLQYIPEGTDEQVFFFNKNEDVLSPGQFRKIKFSFVSKEPGTFKEFWEFILCNITSFDSPDTSKFIVCLSGDTVEDVDKKSGYIDILLQKINTRSEHRMIAELLDDILDNATSDCPYLCPYKNYFLEAELFVLRNPFCYYHQTEVKKLMDRYSEIFGDTKEWDLYLETWRQEMKKLYLEERMQNYDFLKTCHRELLRPWNESEEVKVMKYRAVKLILNKLANKFYDEFIHISKAWGYEDNRVITYPDPTIPRPSTIEPKVVEEAHIVTKLELTAKNIYFMVMYEHVGNSIEMCAGVLSSLDMDRWLQFDFCQM